MLLLQSIRQEMRKQSSPTKAKILQRFFKTGPGEYGEGDVFLGLVVPKIRQLVKKYWLELSYGEIKQLLRSQIHEERLLALLGLVAKFTKGDKKIQTRIYKFYLQNTKHINNWDLVDLTAPNIVGVYLLDKSRLVLYKLVKSKNLWERRIAVLATFSFIKAGQFTDTFKLARILLTDQQDLIHKAVGWMLREVGKRDVAALKKFLRVHYKKMPRTMLRYAIERFPEKLRQKYLSGLV